MVVFKSCSLVISLLLWACLGTLRSQRSLEQRILQGNNIIPASIQVPMAIGTSIVLLWVRIIQPMTSQLDFGNLAPLR